MELPEASNGDLLVIHDTGGYCMALYSKFNSILPRYLHHGKNYCLDFISCNPDHSPVYGYHKTSTGEVEFICFKERETCEDTLEFWGLREPRIL